MSFDLSSASGLSSFATDSSVTDAPSGPPRRPVRASRREGGPREDPDQAGLVAALKANDPGAFDRLVAIYHERLCAVARTYVRDESDVSDVVQEAYLQAFKHIHRFEENSQLGTWLHRITVNAALMLLRSRRRRRELPIIEDAADAGHLERRMAASRTAQRSLEDAEELETLHRRTLDDIRDLPAVYRRIVHLRDIEELSNGDTAATLGITRAAAKSKLLRAHRRLRALAAQRAREN